MKYSLAIFDMDGTILNTLEDITSSVNLVLKKYGYPEHTLEEIRTFVGNGAFKLIERSVPKNTDIDKINLVLKDYLEHYNKHCDIKTAPYAGIVETIKALRKGGIKTAVVSNKGDAEVQKLCIRYFNGLFDFAVGEKANIKKKPAPDAIFEILKELDVKKELSVFIGDSETDIETAKNADIDCIAVSWGFRDISLIKTLGPKAIALEPNDLLEYIL